VPNAICETGTLTSALQLSKLPDGIVLVRIEELERVRAQKYTDRGEYYEATAVVLVDTDAQ
jgi:ATP-dependent Lon protease